MKFKKTVLLFFLVSTNMLADMGYAQGIKYFENEEYAKAFPIISKEAQKGVNKAAQYRLSQMYEKGLGTEVDYKKSSYWYKQAASKYAYTKKKSTPDKDSSFMDRIDSQFDKDNQKSGNEFALGKVDTSTPETKSLFSSLLDGDFFGLTPYHENYLLPFSYSKDKPNRVDPVYGYNSTPNQYNQNMEVVYQLSLKKQITYNLLGLNESILVSYTQKVWWQIYDSSAPFRETNYQPEVFMILPTSDTIDEATGLKVMQIGYLHESNGEEGYRSRSWNRLYATGVWQWDNLFLSTRAWYRIKEERKPDWYYDQSG